MPRDGSGVFSAVPGTTGVPNQPIESADWNGVVADLVTDANTARPVVAGGSGATTAVGGHDAFETKGADVASAATLNLNTTTGAFVDITGTTSVTAVTLTAGRQRLARAVGIFALTAGASLIVNGSTTTNYTTAAGDLLLFEGYAAGIVRVWVLAGLGNVIYLPSGGIIDWNGGDVTITHSADRLAFAGAVNGYTFDWPVIINHTAAIGLGAKLYTNATNAEGIEINAFSTTASVGGTLAFYRSKNAAIGSATVVASGDVLGQLAFYGAQETGTIANLTRGARIRAEVAGTVTSGAGGDMPTSLIFSTTADGAGDVTDQVTIGPTGLLTLVQGQIAFPSTPVNSAGVNTLDGYTDWISYTPTFTGFGTVSGISVWSKRVGDTLYIRGKFTSGTSTAVEARMTLGFNGTNANVNSDATKVASIQQAGYASWSNTGARAYATLIESNVGYITFGSQTGATAGLTKVLGSNFLVSGDVLSFQAEIPISGW